MSMTIHSKLFISEGRGQPVSLKVKIDGCSDHGSNHEMLADIWKDTLKKATSTSATCHYEVETTTEIVNDTDYYFVLGERTVIPNKMATYQQDLYAIRVNNAGQSSLAGIQDKLFTSELFEGSEVNQDAFILPTKHAKKVANRLFIGAGMRKFTRHNEEHYQPGSYFRICRKDETSDDFVADPITQDIAVPCNDTYVGSYLAEMRHVGKATVPVIPQPMRPKSVNPNVYVAAPNADNMLPLSERNGLETPEDVVDHRNNASAFEEKGSHNLSVEHTTPKGIVFTSANTDMLDDERVVMTPLKDGNTHTTMASVIANEVSVTIGNFSQEASSNYHSWSTSSEDRGPGFSFNCPATPVVTPIQANPPQSGVPRESYTVDEQEVFEQEVPPTPIEPKRLHYSTGDDHKERRIDDCLQESVDVEPVEVKSCESNPNGKVTEAGMGMPLMSQQQYLDNEQALVVPTLKPKLTLELDNEQMFGATPQQSKQPASVFPGTTRQSINSNCYTPDKKPVQASRQQQQLHSQSIWPGHYSIQQQHQQQQYYQQYSVYNNGMASVPNALGQPSVKFMQTARERTTTGPNAHRLMQYTTTPFSRAHLMAFYPLDRGKVIHAAPRTCFREGSTLPLQQLEGDRCEIGSGGNGSVFLFKLSGECFAIKKTEYRCNEMLWWSRFNHPNVIPLLAVAMADYSVNCPNKSTCWQVMPQMGGDISSLVDYGTLESIREKKPEESWQMACSNAKHVLKKALCGLEYLHRLGVAHRDIKERNVFYKMSCEHGLPYECTCPGPSKCDVKLGDFDAMAVIQSQSSHVLGTKNYRSPEMLSKETVNSTVDIYAFGCMVMKLVDGRRQYKNESEGISKVIAASDIHQRQYLQELLNIRFKLENILTSKYDEISAFGKFMKDCVNSTPDERPSAAVLLKDPFFDE